MSEISARPITPAQVRAIHAALRRNGIDDDEYRERLRAGWGAESCKELSRRQATDLLRSLGVPLENPPAALREVRSPLQRPEPLPKNVLRLPTCAQRELIAELAGEIDWREANGFDRWLRRNQGLERIATSAQAVAVIEGLKRIARRARV